MAKPSLTNIILFYNMSIGRKELFIKKCNIWLISLEGEYNKLSENYWQQILKVIKLNRHLLKKKFIFKMKNYKYYITVVFRHIK